MDKGNLSIRPTSDPNTREFHTTDKITDQHYVQVSDSEMLSGQFSQSLGPAQGFFRELSGPVKDGNIEKVTLRPHSVKVTKSATASWQQIENNIVSALEKTLDTKLSYTYHNAMAMAQTTRQRVSV